MKNLNYFISNTGISFKSTILLLIILFCFSQSASAKNLYDQKLNVLKKLLGNQDAVLVADPQGRVIFSKNADIQLVPASVLKIFTALVAFHYLGPEYRFATEFYKDQDSNLKVKGYGDPLLISETLVEIVNNIILNFSTKLKNINDLVLDDSYFKAPVLIPGVTSSYEPYDLTELCASILTRSTSDETKMDPM